jgi:hypothetical protein
MGKRLPILGVSKELGNELETDVPQGAVGTEAEDRHLHGSGVNPGGDAVRQSLDANSECNHIGSALRRDISNPRELEESVGLRAAANHESLRNLGQKWEIRSDGWDITEGLE